jgi:uncharacterized protein (TIGR02147 family)
MSIFKFSDLRPFLRSHITQLPKKGRGEISRIARHLGVSTTLVSQVLAGEKSLTPEQAQSLVEYLGLAPLEADYLTYLVQHERAGTPALRKYWKAKILDLRERSLKVANRVSTTRALTDQERAIFYSTPLYSALQLYTTIGKNGKSLTEICERFELNRLKAVEMMTFLTETGLCEEANGRYSPGVQSTHVERSSPHALKNISNWRIRAIQCSERLSERELMYTAPVSLSEADFDLLREEMVEFIKRFLDRVHASPAEEIACFNMDFFWIRK